MPVMDKDEALKECRQLISIVYRKPLTVLRKELAQMSTTGLIQLHRMLSDVSSRLDNPRGDY